MKFNEKIRSLLSQKALPQPARARLGKTRTYIKVDLIKFTGVLLLFPTLIRGAVTTPSGVDTDPLNLDPSVRQALQHFYILDYEGALSRFEKIQAQNPDNPLAVDYVLDAVIFRELYRLDLLDTTLYVQEGFLSGKHPVVEDMHARRSVRMLLVRFAGDIEPRIPPELELSVRERNGEALLLEHRGDLSSLLRWLASVPVADIAIGTEDLRALYDQFHGPNVPDEEAPV